MLISPLDELKLIRVLLQQPIFGFVTIFELEIVSQILIFGSTTVENVLKHGDEHKYQIDDQVSAHNGQYCLLRIIFKFCLNLSVRIRSKETHVEHAYEVDGTLVEKLDVVLICVRVWLDTFNVSRIP